MLFPWPEVLQCVLAVSSGPSGNMQVVCVLVETLRVTVGEQAAEDPRVTSSWGLSNSSLQGGRQLSCWYPWEAAHSALGRTQNCCLRGTAIQEPTILPDLIFL